MKSQLRGLLALAALLMVCWPVESIRAAGRYNAVNPDEAQSVPTHSDYTLTIGSHLDYGLKDLFFVSPTVGYAVSNRGGPGQAAIVYKTTDGGETWHTQVPGCAEYKPNKAPFCWLLPAPHRRRYLPAAFTAAH